VPDAVRVELLSVPLVPEVSIYQVSTEVGLWDGSGGQYHSDQPPPFWAFAWAGGQALARYVLDNADVVAGRDVFDLGTGSGLVAIAAAKAGARSVRASDTDADAIAAVERNARANGVEVLGVVGDPLNTSVTADVILAGDLFYGPTMTNRVMRFLRRAAGGGARALVGDPGRGFLLPDRFDELATYDVPVRSVVEDTSTMYATIWQLRPSAERRVAVAAAPDR
jgi:predicted nicotinamide N-methyase